MATQVPRCRSKALGVVANLSTLMPSSHITATSVGARHFSTAPSTLGSAQPKPSSSSSSSNPKEERKEQQDSVGNHEKDGLKPAEAPKKTVAELDAEMMKKMSGIAGDGGSAGIEYEDGQPVSMKRSVKNNMFRYI